MTGSKRWVTLGGTLAAIAAIIVVIQLTLKPEPPQTSVVASQPAGGGGGSDAPEAADFTGITRWINSEPLSIAKLQGKVVLVDFWTYTCSNCINTLPYLRDWNDKYSGEGLTIVGVHSPEFEFEKEESKVREAIARERIAWPVDMDNDFATWRAYQNRWWPHIDQNGRVRYHHIGEGGYAETERMIRLLLDEAGLRHIRHCPGWIGPETGPWNSRHAGDLRRRRLVQRRVSGELREPIPWQAIRIFRCRGARGGAVLS